jgi:hypothetical protein
MYVPPFTILSSALVIDDVNETVTLPRRVFEMLLAASHDANFDPLWYRSVYPDVAEAVDRGQIGSEIMHFAEGGYREGRLPAAFETDEDWYVQHNADVEAAISGGAVASAHAHYNQVGYFEGRAPDREGEIARARWMQALQPPQQPRPNGVGTNDGGGERGRIDNHMRNDNRAA